MAKLGEYFNNLVKKILGGTPTQDAEVSDAINRIDERINKTSYSNLFEMLANQRKESTNGSIKVGKDELLKIVNVDSDYQDQVFDLFMRRRRYNCYNDITKKISRLKRCISVLRSNIIASDSLKNTSLQFYPYDKNMDIETEIDNARDIFRTLRINEYNNLKMIIDNTLKYGDMFVEIASRKDILPNNRSILMESETDSNSRVRTTIPITFTRKIKNEFNEVEEVEFQKAINVTLDINNSNASLLESENPEDKDISVLDDISLFFHRPHNVIKLTLGDMTYGYLIIPESIIRTRMLFQNINIFDSTQVIQQVTQNVIGTDYVYNEKMYDRGVEITKNLINFLKHNINDEAIEDNAGLKSAIMKLVMSSIYSIGAFDKNGEKFLQDISTITISNMKFRFVDPSRMQEFCLNPDEYAPYGTSIFDSIMFDASLLVADKVTSSIERLTKSIERRIINFEIENRDSKSIIERLKERFRKKKALFDGSLTFDNIPSVLSPFEEYYIPTREGQPFVNFTTEPPSSTVGGSVEDMKFKRDEAVSNLDVPPAYVGLEENIESKATLFLQSELFAITIIDYQEMFATCYTDLLDKIKNLLGLPTRHVLVKFATPVILSTASELEHISTVSGSSDFLIQMGLDKRDIIDRYLPFLQEYYSQEVVTKRNIENLEHGKEGADEEEGAGAGGF